ncbi:MAG: shikimate kinase [Alphaproteobacteria bacterium]|nr:shikimate kinase [Alphaproteobacteria bacterium]
MLDRPLPVLRRPLVLIGMMGAGKTTIGRRLAERLGVGFVDADREIEAAAGRSIPEIFEEYGEAHFRDGERRVIARLLDAEPFILATGGGAFMDEETRELIATRATSLWLRADLDLLWARVSKRGHRPLLHTENPRQTLADLVERRYPVYAEADLVVDSLDGPKDDTVNACIDALQDASL